MFGNPGSTELPMLARLPRGLPLRPRAAGGGRGRDGRRLRAGERRARRTSTSTPRPGVGNAMGAIFNAQANHSPLVITAGQQARSLVTLQANLTNRDATRMPHPLVKWSYEPPRARGRAARARARDPPRDACRRAGPTFVSIPMDDWDAEVDDADARRAIERRIERPRRRRRPRRSRDSPERLEAARSPVLVAGPDIDASGAWDAAVALAERQRLPVFATPPTGGGRLGFPEGHPNFRGILPPAIGPVARDARAATTWSSSSAPRSSRTTPTSRARCSPEGAELVADHLRPRRGRAGADGRRDRRRREAHARGAARRGRRVRPRPRRAAARADGRARSSEPITGDGGDARARRSAFPEDGIVVLEAPSSTLALRNQLRLSRPGSYYFGAGGGLGFGLAAAVGVQLAAARPPGRLRARRGLGRSTR